MKISSNTKIGKIVAMNLNTAAVFEKYGIDYCCHGEATLSDACTQNKIDMDIILNDLKTQLVKEHSLSNEINDMTVDKLINHIVEVHHSYLKSIIPEIKKHLNKIVEVHGERHSDLHEIKQLFNSVQLDILSHLDKEENVVYPYIKKLLKKHKYNSVPENDIGKSLKKMVADLEKEHESVGEVIDRIHKITSNYKEPSDACNTFKLALKELKDLEMDMHLHIVKENQLLHPKALLLEDCLFNQQ